MSIEALGEKSVIPSDKSDLPAWRKMAILAGSIGALILPATATAHTSSNVTPTILSREFDPPVNTVPRPMERVGVVAPELMTGNFDEARTIAKNIKEAGFNSVRVVVPYVEGEAGNVANDWNQFCNAAGAAMEQGLNFTLTFQGYYQDGTLGYVPPNKYEIRKFETTVLAYEDGLIGARKDENPDGAPRCSTLPRPMNGADFEIFNEWNLDDFVRDQQNAARNLVNILSIIYPAIKKEAGKEGVDFNVWTGALTSAHDPVGFIKAVGQEKTRRHMRKVKLFDVWSHHPYMPASYVSPETPSAKGNTIGISDYSIFTAALRKYLGYTGPVVDDEFGVQSAIPPDKLPAYNNNTGPEASLVPEATQAEFYRQAYSTVICQRGNKGLYLFHFRDGNGPKETWRQSGELYPDGTPKSSYPSISNTLWQAQNGTLVPFCPAVPAG